LAEVIKYGIIKDRKLFLYLENNYKDIINLKAEKLEHIVRACVKIKAGIVSLDEREEKGLRTVLNFGHTIGHAVEAAAGFNKYNHGEAIALGMLVALDISVKLGLVKEALLKRVEKLINNVGLPIKISKVSLQKILSSHYHDKKFMGAKNKFVLTTGLGRTRIVKDISLKLISSAIEERF
jgi:3-dehydroquinate synthase